MKANKLSGVVVIACVVLSLSGSALILWGTRNGIGLWVDSASYIGAARNLLAQRGLTLPYEGDQTFSVLAPLYTLALAGVGAAGFDVLEGVRWFSAFLFGATLLVTGLSVIFYGRSKTFVPVVATLAVLVTPELFQLHQFALSEGLFFLTGTLGMILLARYCDTSKQHFLVLSGGMIALACLTRYVGVVFIGTGALGILLDPHDEWRSRLKHCAVWTSICLAPLIVWGLFVSAFEKGPSSHALGWNPVPIWKLALAADVVRSWILPELIPSLLFVAGLPAIVFIAARSRFVRELLFPSKPVQLASLPRLLVLFNILYAFFLIFVITFLDPATATSGRILAPAHLATIMLAAYAWQRVEERPERPAIRMFARLCAVWILVLCVVRFPAAFSRNTLVVSPDFAAKEWATSEVIEDIKHLPETTRIYTNAPEAVYLLTGRSSTALPKKYIPRLNRFNGRFDEEMATIKKDMNQDAVVVFFNAMRRGFLPTKEELVDYFSLHPVSEEADGTILKYLPATE